MLNTSGLVYLCARTMSAAGNLLAVVVFSRLAGPAEYGHYVLIFAWSLIAYGFGAQWMRFAYFGVYHPGRFGEYVGSLAGLLLIGVTAVALVLTALGVFGFFEPSFLFAVFALVCGMTIYEAAFEVARTLLNARGAALSMILRATLTVALGSTSLWFGGGARGLAIAIAAGHTLAALPSLATFSKFRFSDFSRGASLHIVSYGWPLFLSFGVTAIGQSIDRLLLAHYLGLAVLGPYGVVADILRQSFTVLGEAIILSLVTVAKQHANAGDRQATDKTLMLAFNACLAAATLGAAFFIVFGDVALQALLKPEFVAPTRGLIPIFAVGFAFMVMRSFYFGQVIYFSNASYLELVVSLLALVASMALSLTLVPEFGVHGAAIALMVSSIIGCIAFFALGRRRYRMPIDFIALGVMPSVATLFVFGAHTTAALFPSQFMRLCADAVAFAMLGIYVMRRFGLLSLPTPDGAVLKLDGTPGRAATDTILSADQLPIGRSTRQMVAGEQAAHQIEFLGLPFNTLSQPQAVQLIIDGRGAPYRYVVTPNAYHVVTIHDQPKHLLPLYQGAWLSLCDSRIVRSLARFERLSLPLVTGSDLVAALLATLNGRDPSHAPQRILVVGPPHSIQPALHAAYPNVHFEIVPAPAGLANSAELRLALARACMDRRWDIALLCVGCPAQELVARQLAELGCKSGVALCVGSAVDFLVGSRTRAPRWLQKLSLEWAYRLAQEPQRLWHRYLVQSPRIFRIFMATRSIGGR
jgi:exopolysaccharide biosynthesis WecB/TagA/CpsF family protein